MCVSPRLLPHRLTENDALVPKRCDDPLKPHPIWVLLIAGREVVSQVSFGGLAEGFEARSLCAD